VQFHDVSVQRLTCASNAPLEQANGLLRAAWALQVHLLLRLVGRFHPLTSLLFPIPVMFFIAIFLRSAVCMMLSRPMEWRGRTIAPGPPRQLGVRPLTHSARGLTPCDAAWGALWGTALEQDTKRASKTPSSADSRSTQPPQNSGEPDNESQYGGGRQVDMPRQQNRDTANPPKASRQKAPADNGRVPNSSGPSDGSA